MKQIQFLALVLSISAFNFTSCDYVEDPTPAGSGLSADCDTVFSVTDPVVSQKNVLIEDFSGHKCPNCPDAAVEAESIHATHGDRVIVVTIHPDPNVTPGISSFVSENSSGNKYTTVWYIPEGGEIYDLFGNPGYLPVGMVDRISATFGKYIDYQDWDTHVSNRLTEPLEVSMVGKAELLADGETVCGQIKSEFLTSTTIVDEFRIVHYLVEDSIVDWQQDGSTDIANYVHRHVLRAVSNDNILGDLVASAGTVSSGTTNEHFFSFEDYTFVDPDKLHIVSFIYDTDSDEVMQVITFHVD